MSTKPRNLIAAPSRREFLYHGGMGLGAVALSALIAQDRARAAIRPLAPKKPDFPAKAKHCIFLLMEGGPSHMDTFDPKPGLDRLHMTRFQKEQTRFEAD